MFVRQRSALPTALGLASLALLAAVALFLLWPNAAGGQDDQHAIQVDDRSQTTIAVSWQDAGSSYYALAWWPTDYSSFKSALVFTTEHTITDLKPGTTYVVDVSGVGKREISTLTLGPPPPPPPEVSISGGSGITEGGNAVFTVSANPAPSAPLTVSVAVRQRGKFGVPNGTRSATIPASGSTTLTVRTTDDSTDEANGSVTATLSAGAGYTVSGTQRAATIAVSDNDDPPISDPVVSVSGGSNITEGGNAVFTVSANPAPSASLLVSVNVSQIGDFGVNSGARVVTISNSGSTTLTVSTTDDSVDEANGSVTATLSAGAGYTVSATQRAATIAVSDNDDPPISDPVVSISGGSGITEGGNAVFTVSANPAPSASLSVSVNVSQIGDFGVNSGARTVTISSSGSATITVATTDDSTDEANGSVTATLSTGAGYSVGSAGSATVAIADDDDPPLTTQQQSNEDLEELIQERIDLTVSKGDGWSERIWRRALATVRGETPPNGWAPISEGQAQRISDGHRGRGNTDLADLWQAIFDHITGVSNSVEPEISISAGSSITEGGDAIFTVTANPPPSANLSVSVGVTQSGDFGVIAATHAVTIPTGGSATLTLSTTDDGVDEADGSVTATLAAGSGYTVSATQGTATLAVSDDDVPEISIAAGGGVTEGASAVFTLSASPTPASPLSVSVSIGAQGDFGVTTGAHTVTIPAGGTATLTVSTTDDSADEADGSVTATLTSGNGYTVSVSQSAATVAVSDDDDPPLPPNQQLQEFVPDAPLVATLQAKIDGQRNQDAVARLNKILNGINGEAGGYSSTECREEARKWGVLSTWASWCDEIERREDFVPVPTADPMVSIAAGADISEGGDAVFTVTANPAPSADLSVSISVTQSGDFGVTTGSHTVTIPTGGSATLTVSTTDDDVDEADGSVTATLQTGQSYAVSATQQTATVGIADDDTSSLNDGQQPEGTLGDAFVASLKSAMQMTANTQQSAQFSEMAVQQGLQQRVQQQAPPPTGTSIVYVVDDSGSMDGDWPEVISALKEVRDMSGVTDTKVALISFGTASTTLFGLTDHATVDWEATLSGYSGTEAYLNGLTPITSFGGFKGGTSYTGPLQAAKALLDGDSAATKMIVFMSDAQGAADGLYPAAAMIDIILDGITIDTIFYGDQHADLESDLMKMSAGTGGTHTNVFKPRKGTTNDPAVTARSIEDILVEKAAANTTTLYLVDSSFSLMQRTDTGSLIKSHIHAALEAVETKVHNTTTTARVGVARFLGVNEISDLEITVTIIVNGETRVIEIDEPRYKVYYDLFTEFGTGTAFDFGDINDFWMAQTGSTDLDNALNQAHASISGESGTTKRVVLITDGITPTKPTAATLLQYDNDDIELHVVAMGDNADRVYLKELSESSTNPSSGWTFNVAETPTLPEPEDDGG